MQLQTDVSPLFASTRQLGFPRVFFLFVSGSVYSYHAHAYVDVMYQFVCRSLDLKISCKMQRVTDLPHQTSRSVLAAPTHQYTR